MSKTKVTSTSPKAPQVQVKKMDFYDAIRQIIAGKCVTRIEWLNPEIFLKLVDGHLEIHKLDDKFYDLIVSDGDMLAEDWMLV
jgi:hypothetical protein